MTVGESARHTHVFVHGGHPLVIYGKLSSTNSGFASGQNWVGELPNITGDVWNFARQAKSQQITTSGVFSSRNVKEGQAYATEMIYDDYDGITMSFGNDEYHNNIPPCVASNIWYRTA